MSFREARLSLQLLVEEEIGGPQRGEAYRKKAEEDAVFEKAKGV